MKTEPGYFSVETVCKDHSCDYCTKDAVKENRIEIEEAVGDGFGLVQLEACTCLEHSQGIVWKLIRERTANGN